MASPLCASAAEIICHRSLESRNSRNSHSDRAQRTRWQVKEPEGMQWGLRCGHLESDSCPAFPCVVLPRGYLQKSGDLPWWPPWCHKNRTGNWSALSIEMLRGWGAGVLGPLSCLCCASVVHSVLRPTMSSMNSAAPAGS